MDGIILVNKEKGMTSFDVVNKCRKIFHEKSIGHTGTLDPNATGLLIILLGKYTKLVPYCIKDHKHYLATFSLGKKSDTEDIWGNIIAEKAPKNHSEEEINTASKEMLGNLKQKPPMYSAIKYKGKKLYEYARMGQTVEVESRDIHVSKFDVKKIDDTTYFLDTIVSSGTYVRTLIGDFASKLDEYAIMTDLERIAIENISVINAYTLNDLENGHYELLNPLEILDPSYKIVEYEKVEDIYNGKKISLDIVDNNVIFVWGGKVLAAYKRGNDNLFHSQRGLF